MQQLCFCDVFLFNLSQDSVAGVIDDDSEEQFGVWLNAPSCSSRAALLTVTC